MKTQKSTSRVWKGFIKGSGGFLILVIALFIPWSSWNLASHPKPVDSYEEAVQRIQIVQSSEGADFNPLCRTQLFTHEEKVERVIIFVHGYTNCPQQFAELGARFFDLGYNVLIAPLPHHGLADRTTPDLANLKAEELTLYADQVVDIAQGLGDHVTMVGISGGGVTTAWAAQHRSDLDLAVIISPAFGFSKVPTALTTPAMNYYLIKSNSFIWWDPELKEKEGIRHAYAQYSTRALAQILRLSLNVQMDARKSAPAAKEIVYITNANDPDINLPLAYDVLKDWQSHGTGNFRTYEFSADHKLLHDFIDPAQPAQQVGFVYPILIDLITK